MFVKKRRVKLKKGVWLGLLGILAAIVILIEVFSAGDTDSHAHFVQTMSFNTFGETSAYSAQGGMFLRDGATLSFYEPDGTRLFRRSNIASLGNLFVNDGFGAIVVQGSNFVEMHSNGGLMYTAIIDGAISRFAIGQNGYAVAIVSYTGQYKVMLIDQTGRTHLLTLLDDAGKISTAIAMHGNVIVLAQADLSGVLLNSTITLMTFSSHASRYSAEIIAINLYNPQQIIGQIHFANSDVIVIISSSRIFGIDSASGNTVWSIELQNNVQAFYIGQEHFVIAYGAGILNLGAHGIGDVNVHNFNGQVVLSTFKNNVTNVATSCGYLVVQSHGYTSIYDIELGEVVTQMHLAGRAGFLGSANAIFVLATEDMRIYERRR